MSQTLTKIINTKQKKEKKEKKPRDYSKGLIYKLVCLDEKIKDVYVGSTINFTNRKSKHKSSCLKGSDKTYKYRFMRENGSWNNWHMEFITFFPCETKRELEAEEGKYVRSEGGTLNKNMPGGYFEIDFNEPKVYKLSEKTRAKQREYYAKHKEEIRIKQNKHYKDNKEKVRERVKKYSATNRGKEVSRLSSMRYYAKKKLTQTEPLK